MVMPTKTSSRVSAKSWGRFENSKPADLHLLQKAHGDFWRRYFVMSVANRVIHRLRRGVKREQGVSVRHLSRELLRLGHKQKGRKERIAAIQHVLGGRLGWDEARFARLTWRLPSEV